MPQRTRTDMEVTHIMTSEMKAAPQTKCLLDGNALDKDSMKAIRAMIEDAKATDAQAATARQAAAPAMAQPEKRAGRFSRKIAVPQEGSAAQSEGLLTQLMSRIMGYRPTTKHLVIAGFALLLVLRPWIVFWSLVFGVFAMAGLFLALGYDGFWQRAMTLGRWYAKRRPTQAQALNRKLDGFAMKWDMILDRFPEGTVDGLYLPDFGELASAESRHEAVLDRRFANLSNSEV